MFIDALTLPTPAPTVLTDDGIGQGELMPLLTVRPLAVSGSGRLTAPQILQRRNWLKVSWVYAGPVPTQMVKLQTVWNGAKPQFIHSPVDVDFSPVARTSVGVTYLSVTTPSFASGP